ncbi:MAG: PEP-CTERM sorting domain-containing protein [Okeania sp. SIO3I5]|uniref:PEP-CTERM sorting domain-containing protein n=1 Tax=Okeania sp. SIO3I5 TaxID=2607805 RepID=UPI0013B81386|nr:PEP-CTERM sorting domain-containing protein [Okeania sp. SIO3I5]NEQ39524.1 PEP-CTERM sorting domain-containing protein [Okeania sp. SIO3I5]
MLNNQLQTKKVINFFRYTILKSLATVTVLAPILMPTSAKAVTINFDQFNDFQIIPGDTFQDSNVIFDQEFLIVNTNIQRPALSSPGAALGLDPVAGTITGYFTEAEEVGFISVFAGDYRLDDRETITLKGFDEFDNLLASDTFTSSTAQSLSISSPGIVRFEIDIIERGGIDNFTFSSTSQPVNEDPTPSNPIFAPISIPSNPDGSITINFDLDLFSTSDDAVIVGDNFSNLGVIFDDPLRLWNISPEDNPVGGSAESTTTIATNDNSLGGNISGSFTEAVDFVSVFAGDSGGDVDNVTLIGFDQFGNIVDSDTFENTEAETLSISGAGITRFEIQNMGAIAIDDFTFNPTPKSTPEPASVLGLLAFGAIGATCRLKRK